jgi:hypothetical protein
MGNVLRELERAAAAVQRREELVIEATKQGHSRREVQRAAGFKSVNSVQAILKRAGLLAIFALAVVAPSAGATTITVVDGSPDYPYQRWADVARTPTPNATLTVVEAPCSESDAGSCTAPGTYTIRMGPKPGRDFARLSFLHELGHNFDYYAMADEARATYMNIRGFGGEWRQPIGTASPHERFAEDYAVCSRWYRRVEGKPRFSRDIDIGTTPRRLGSICHLIRSVG